MKTFIAGAAAIAALFVGGTAHADAMGPYLNDLQAGGFAITAENTSEAMGLGLAVCVDLFNGVTPASEITDLVKVGLTQEQADTVYAAATKNICPKAAGHADPKTPVSGGLGGRFT